MWKSCFRLSLLPLRLCAALAGATAAPNTTTVTRRRRRASEERWRFPGTPKSRPSPASRPIPKTCDATTTTSVPNTPPAAGSSRASGGAARCKMWDYWPESFDMKMFGAVSASVSSTRVCLCKTPADVLCVQAVCCSDKEHCCPQGYTCDTLSRTCQKLIMLQLQTLPLTPVYLPEYHLQLAPLKHKNIQCDEETSCPDNSTCCKISPTTWGCCPSPHVWNA